MAPPNPKSEIPNPQSPVSVRDVVAELERIAPPQLSQSWDNVGLLIGDAAGPARRVMLCIDLTPAVLDEALRARCSMVMAYHPPIFKPISRVTADRSAVVYAAVRSGLSVYSMHTAWDAAEGGLNDILADAIGMAAGRRPLRGEPVKDYCKIAIFAPAAQLQKVSRAAYDAGAGQVGNYFDCGFHVEGTGTFCCGADTHPSIGRPGRCESVQEVRLEVIAPRSRAAAVCSAVRAAHSYEEPVIDVYPVDLYKEDYGVGRVGPLARPASLAALVRRVKQACGVDGCMVARAVPEAVSGGVSRASCPRVERASSPAGPGGEGVSGGISGDVIQTIACCAGSGGDVFRDAVAAGAGLYVTGEMRHHDALEATGRGMNVICVGHSNSERLGLARLAEDLRTRIGALTVSVASSDRDPFTIG